MEHKKSIVESLLEEGLITREQLDSVREEEKRTGAKARTLLVEMGFIAEEDLVSFMSGNLALPKIELSNYIIDPELLDIIPADLVKKHQIVPVFKVGRKLTCAMSDPMDVFAIDEIHAMTNMEILPALATRADIKKVLGDHYGTKGSIEEVLKTIKEEESGLEIRHESGDQAVKELEISAEKPAVIRVVNSLIMQAVREGASDIHIEPEEDRLVTRFRVDGMLHEASVPPQHLQAAIISRVKIMSGLNIAERRRPQDGRFSVKMHEKEMDVRVSCVPTIHGESIALRLLDVSSPLLNLPQLGFSKKVARAYNDLISRPHGLVLVTGPTGSGKTTTLYSALAKISTRDKNVITVEDPVEYRLAGVRQIQVNPKVNLTFANGLRSILRQDPDIIMVGEMRDYETVEIAIQAALTGHLVLSTLHTNNAAGAVTRIVDIGAKPFLVASSVIGILAQRLVRKICAMCKESYVPSEEVLKAIGRDPQAFGEGKMYRGKGCSYCNRTGYKGRVAIGELLIIDNDIRDLILSKASSQTIQEKAVSKGMVTLVEAGIQKVMEGETTIEEVLRVSKE